MNPINEKKLRELNFKYEKARKLAQMYLFDTDYVINIVDMLVGKGVMMIDKSDRNIFNPDTETYTPHFAMHIWRECVLPVIGLTYEEYEVMNVLHKMSKSLK